MKKNIGKKKIVVIKCGGRILEEEALKKKLIEDIVFLSRNNFFPVIVHGGGIQVTKMLESLGKKTRFVNGLRFTDEDTLEVVEMVLSAKMNKDLVALINSSRGHAVGLSGKDGPIVIARKTKENLGMVGEVNKVNTELLDILLGSKFIPVISSISMNAKGQTLNINADTMACAIAVALKAEEFILLTDVAGVIYEDAVLNEIKIKNINKLIREGVVLRGMIPKVKACRKAINGGVKKCHIMSVKGKHSLVKTICEGKNSGTKIIK